MVIGEKEREKEDAFWLACYERHTTPDEFAQREAYLKLVHEDEYDAETHTLEADLTVPVVTKGMRDVEIDKNGNVNAMTGVLEEMEMG